MQSALTVALTVVKTQDLSDMTMIKLNPLVCEVPMPADRPHLQNLVATVAQEAPALTQPNEAPPEGTPDSPAAAPSNQATTDPLAPTAGSQVSQLWYPWC